MERKYLEQAAQAERLARFMTDSVTIERLMVFAAECRAKVSDERRLESA